MAHAETVPVARLERAFQALSDEKRLRILEILQGGECCVCDLAIALDIRQSLLSFHLRTLREAGLVRDRKEGRWVHYSLDEAALREARDHVSGLIESARAGIGLRCCRHAKRGNRRATD
jgi:ArsR family transcriptional regulator